MNYVLFVIGLSIVRKIIETLIYIHSKIQRKPPEVEVENGLNLPSADETFLDELTIPLVSIPQMENGKIKSTVGLVPGEAIAKEKETSGLLSKLTSIIQPIKMEDSYLGDARKDAISRMLENAKLIGANTVVEVMVGYVSRWAARKCIYCNSYRDCSHL